MLDFLSFSKSNPYPNQTLAFEVSAAGSFSAASMSKAAPFTGEKSTACLLYFDGLSEITAHEYEPDNARCEEPVERSF